MKIEKLKFNFNKGPLLTTKKNLLTNTTNIGLKNKKIHGKNKKKKINNHFEFKQKNPFYLATVALILLTLTHIPNTKLSIMLSVIGILSFTVIFIYQKGMYERPLFVGFNLLSLIIVDTVPGLSGIYFILCLIIFVTLYLYKRDHYIIDFIFLTIISILVSFLFYKYYLIKEFESAITIVQHLIEFTGDVDSLTINIKFMLENTYKPYPDNELMFRLNESEMMEMILFLIQSKEVNPALDFIGVYTFFVSWIAEFFPIMKIYVIIS